MANRPTVGGSDGTWGTELNAYLDVSLDTDGKVDDGAAQTTSAAPGADEELTNKKYTDDQDTAQFASGGVIENIFGSWTDKDSGGSVELAADEVYKVGSDGFVCMYTILNINQNVWGHSNSTNSFSASTRKQLAKQNMPGGWTMPVKKDDYWKVESNGITITKIQWLPIGTGTCVKQ